MRISLTYRTTVSIHAFRGEGDRHRSGSILVVEVSIHAFRGEGDSRKRTASGFQTSFQSTPSGGKATYDAVWARLRDVVSIHAFRGEGDRFLQLWTGKLCGVSIHAFRGEGDPSAIQY